MSFRQQTYCSRYFEALMNAIKEAKVRETNSIGEENNSREARRL